MVLTRSQCENISKEKLIQESTKLSNPSEKANKFLSKCDKVHSELQQCKNFNSHLLTRITQLERNAVTNSYYSRR